MTKPSESDRVFHAIYSRDVPGLESLLLSGASPDCIDEDGDSALYVAAYTNEELTLTLLKMGADPNFVYQRSSLPLLGALRSNNDSSLHSLIQFGARMDAVDALLDQTALHWICEKGTPEQAMIALTSNARGKIEAMHTFDYLSRCPIHCAVYSGNISRVKLLLQHGDCIDRQTDIELLTPCHVAAIKGDIPMLVTLILMKADLSLRDMDGRTPMDIMGDSWKNVENELNHKSE
jgi:ankyrin repeat protein